MYYYGKIDNNDDSVFCNFYKSKYNHVNISVLTSEECKAAIKSICTVNQFS